jgi:DNA-binding transcriptional regulator YdaS (Cro superfamily)
MTRPALTPQEALKLARDRSGGPAALAKKLDISSQAVVQWDIVPPLRVLAVEAATGVSRHDLRPDLYPRETAERPA